MVTRNRRHSEITVLAFTKVTLTKRGLITSAVEQFEHLYKETQNNNSESESSSPSHLKEEKGNWIVPENIKHGGK